MNRYKVELDPRDGKYYCVVDTHKYNRVVVEEIQLGEITASSVLEYVIKVETEMSIRCDALNEEYENYLKLINDLN